MEGQSSLLVDPSLRQELDEVVSSMCKALNDPKRLVALYALRDGPHTVTELCVALGAPQANTSQHLAVLRERGLVKATRDGNRVLYSLRHPRVLEAVDTLRGIVAEESAKRRGDGEANNRPRLAAAS
jgi:DNA-binding transcriptional ArsR family regulator